MELEKEQILHLDEKHEALTQASRKIILVDKL
jgi:hypothetical protein